MRKRAINPMQAMVYITLTIKAVREGDVWVGVCDELGVSTFDESLDTLLKELRILILQHMNALERSGARAEFFKKHGIEVHAAGVAIPPRRVPVASGTVVTRLTERIPALPAGA
jgi:predicted RNase H-like HicB family nuclease